MRPRSHFAVHWRLFALCTLSVAATAVDARAPGHAPGGTQMGPVYGRAGWVGGPYRPGYGVGYGWRAGYPGWRYGYPGYGYRGYGYPGYGYGFGWGLGYGAGWALATAPLWGWGAAPAAVYVDPSFYPYGVAQPAYPPLTEFVEPGVQQQPPAAVPAPQTAPQVAPQSPGYWYYCTEPAGYYPYVGQCLRPWTAVQPNRVPQ